MRNIDIRVTAIQLIQFIHSTMNKTGFSYVVVAVSGGVDSATSASLAVRALGRNNIHALLLPYGDWHDEALKHSQLLLKQLEIPESHIHEVDITLMVNSILPPLKLRGGGGELLSTKLERVRIGNIMARTRMIILFDYAKKLNALVLGTENKSEHYLGYFTRFGDEASDIEPLRQLYKTEVYRLAKYLKVPEEIIRKAPTAGLWSGQTDEGEFGFAYKEADEVLCGLFEDKMSEAELVKRGLSRVIVQKVKKWVKQVEFKQRLPIVAPKPVIL